MPDASIESFQYLGRGVEEVFREDQLAAIMALLEAEQGMLLHGGPYCASFCRQNWTAERLNRMEDMIRGLRARLHQARQPLTFDAFHLGEEEVSSSADARHPASNDEASEPCWHLRSDDALSEADSLEIVQGLERQLDCIRDSLASCSNSFSEDQVCAHQ